MTIHFRRLFATSYRLEIHENIVLHMSDCSTAAFEMQVLDLLNVRSIIDVDDIMLGVFYLRQGRYKCNNGKSTNQM